MEIHLRRRIQQLEGQVRRLKSEVSALRRYKTQTSSAAFANQNFSNLLNGSFSSAQISVVTKKLKRPRKWTEDDIANGLILRSFSRKSYDFLREKKLLPLPSETAMRKWVKSFSCQPGILHDMKKVLQRFFETEESPLARLAVISFDEMEICKILEYDHESDRVFGPHKKLQLVMVRGLCKKWKQPIFYDFDTPMRKGLLFEIVEHAENIGILVYGVNFDLGNRGLLTSLGVTEDDPFFTNPADDSRRIYVFPDAPHELKLCRNHLLDDGYLFGSGTKLTKEDFEQLLQEDNSELKICHKLTIAHLDCHGNARQRVRPAAQLLSHSTAAAFRCLFPEKKEEAEWIDLINAWFDVLNSRLKFDANPQKSAFGTNLPQQKAILETFCQKMQETRSLKHKSLLPFQRGMLISSRALLLLFEDLQQNYGVEYIRTACLNQDICENFFSRIRALGRTDDHPGIIQQCLMLYPRASLLPLVT